MELKPNQAALILNASDEGEISVNVATLIEDSLAAEVCRIIAQKLDSDEKFQAGILAVLEGSKEKGVKSSVDLTHDYV